MVYFQTDSIWMIQETRNILFTPYPTKSFMVQPMVVVFLKCLKQKHYLCSAVLDAQVLFHFSSKKICMPIKWVTFNGNIININEKESHGGIYAIPWSGTRKVITWNKGCKFYPLVENCNLSSLGDGVWNFELTQIIFQTLACILPNCINS